MANYFKSSDVKVFPCAYRGQGIDMEASSFTEYNFTNIYSKQGLKKESFIISYTDNKLKCVIGGYYFEIQNLNNYFTNEAAKANYQYLGITVSNKELVPFGESAPNVLDDENDNFLGIAGSTDNPDSATAVLQLFDKHTHTIGEDDANPTYTYTLCEGSLRLEDIINTGGGAYSIASYYTDNEQKLLNVASGKHSIAYGEKVFAENDYAVILGEKLKSSASNQIILGTGITSEVTEVTEADNDANIQFFKDGESIYKLDNNGNETIIGNIKTNGIEETDKVVITKPVKIDYALNVSGKITADDDLELAKKAILNDTLNVAGATEIKDTLTIKKSDATTTINENGIQTNKAITSTGNISTSANLSVSGTASIIGKTTTSNIELNGNNVDYITAGSNKLDKNGNLNIAGNINSEKIKVTKTNNATTITLSGDANISGNTTIGGKLKSKYIEEDPTNSNNTLKLTAGKINADNSSLVIKDLKLTNNIGISIANKEYNDLVPSTQTEGKKIYNNNAVCLNTGIDTIGPITAYYNGTDKEYAFAAFSPNKNLTSGIKFDGTTYFKQRLIVGGDNINLDIPVNDPISGVTTKLANNNCLFYVGTFGAAVKDNLAIGGNTYFGGDVDINATKTITFGDQIKINLNGNGSIIATSFGTSSDIRLKQNIKSYKNDKSILDLDVKEFEYINDNTHKKHIGAIAQEVKEICPELVYEDANGYLSIEENKLVYLLLNEVKELKKEIKSLKGE